MKNINSLRNIKNAIEYEIKRQQQDLPKEQETRMYNETKGITIKMRSKEQAHDYRFINDPDLPIINIAEKRVKELKQKLPETPLEKLEKLIKKYKIEEKPAKILTKKLEIVEFFEKIIEKTDSKLAVRWVTEELLSVLNYNKKELDNVEINPEHFIELLNLIKDKTITELKAKDILRSWKEKSSSPKVLAKKQSTISDTSEIEKIVDKVIKENKKAVNDYKNGEEKAMNFLVGMVMKLSDKRADYRTAKEILEKKLR
jgi:aspartyl-tRNA(Asn)/glutamyl-tRNA(Gln) amidotransferase subunit B